MPVAQASPQQGAILPLPAPPTAVMGCPLCPLHPPRPRALAHMPPALPAPRPRSPCCVPVDWRLCHCRHGNVVGDVPLRQRPGPQLCQQDLQVRVRVQAPHAVDEVRYVPHHQVAARVQHMHEHATRSSELTSLGRGRSTLQHRCTNRRDQSTTRVTHVLDSQPGRPLPRHSPSQEPASHHAARGDKGSPTSLPGAPPGAGTRPGTRAWLTAAAVGPGQARPRRTPARASWPRTGTNVRHMAPSVPALCSQSLAVVEQHRHGSATVRQDGPHTALHYKRRAHVPSTSPGPPVCKPSRPPPLQHQTATYLTPPPLPCCAPMGSHPSPCASPRPHLQHHCVCILEERGNGAAVVPRERRHVCILRAAGGWSRQRGSRFKWQGSSHDKC